MIKMNHYALLIVASLFAVSANAAPMAYSVNSDSNGGDSLYLIDLATGVDQFRGKLFTGIEERTDTEGLAFSPEPNSRLWGMDDASGTLFPINTANGSINYEEEIQLPVEFQTGGGNDFGMTFACDYNLFFTSVRTKPPRPGRQRQYRGYRTISWHKHQCHRGFRQPDKAVRIG